MKQTQLKLKWKDTWRNFNRGELLRRASWPAGVKIKRIWKLLNHKPTYWKSDNRWNWVEYQPTYEDMNANDWEIYEG